MTFGESIWTMGIPLMMNVAGTPCTASLASGTVEFLGIVDQAETVEETDMGTIHRMDSVLRVDRDVGKQFKGLVNTPITIGGVAYIANEPLFEDDGNTAIMPIYPADDTNRFGW